MNLHMLQQMAVRGEKIAVMTSYDASFSTLCEQAGVDILLVGDSLGMVLQGASNTLAVTVRDMQYHTRCVARGVDKAYIIADLPFGSYQLSPEQALRNATRMLAAGAHMVKLEGGAVMLETVRFLVQRGIPVCAHLGFTPQSVNQLGGYRIQGRSEQEAAQLLADAQGMQQAGASMLVLEMIPAALAREVSTVLNIPTIGVGAGVDCDGQVLVLHDALGIFAGKSPRFAKNFMEGAASIQEAIALYVSAVKAKQFPAAEHSF